MDQPRQGPEAQKNAQTKARRGKGGRATSTHNREGCVGPFSNSQKKRGGAFH